MKGRGQLRLSVAAGLVFMVVRNMTYKAGQLEEQLGAEGKGGSELSVLIQK